MNTYYEQMILGASPIDLVRFLYQRAIQRVREARAHLAAGRIAERSAAINNSWAVLMELSGALSPDPCPELAERLLGLYAYMQNRLVTANLLQADEPLAEVLGLLTVLSEAWNGIESEGRGTHAVSGLPGAFRGNERADPSCVSRASLGLAISA